VSRVYIIRLPGDHTELPYSAKAIWDFEGIFCSSQHLPHIRFPGLIHPGILGCAPSAQVLAEWNGREAELISTTDLKRIVAQPPQPQNVHAGSASGDVKAKVGKEGARTIPGRPEHGGNCDIKNLSRGSKVYLPIHVPGAKFSVGDLHFLQGGRRDLLLRGDRDGGRHHSEVERDEGRDAGFGDEEPPFPAGSGGAALWPREVLDV